MSRPIDAEATLATLKASGVISEFGVYLIKNMPTFDPFVHAKWELSYERFAPTYRCTAWGYHMPLSSGDKLADEIKNYCPFCGAKMDGDI